MVVVCPFFQTRSAATKLISGKKLRLNGEVMSKPHRQAQIGQILTFPQANQIRVIQIDALGTRRGLPARQQNYIQIWRHQRQEKQKEKTLIILPLRPEIPGLAGQQKKTGAIPKG